MIERGDAVPTGQEKLFLLAWSLVVLLLCFAPIAKGYATAGEGWSFTGFHAANLNDYQGYMAWMRQAWDGEVLFVNKFVDGSERRLVLHPLFWLIGSSARWLGVPIIASWLVVEALSLLLLVWALWRFAAEFARSPATRMLAVMLATTASGLGWLWPREQAALVERPIDLWMPAANGILAICSSFFTLTLGLALMLLAAVRMRHYLDGGRLREAAIGGLIVLALASVHPYDVITVYAVFAAWTLMAGRRRWPGMAVVVAISAPYMLYGFLATRLDPILSQVSFFMPMVTPGAMLIGWGLPLGLAAAALAVPAVRREHPQVALLGVWLFVQLALLAAPFDFRRKLIWGLHAVICLLAAMALRHLIVWLTRGLRGGRRSPLAGSLGTAAGAAVGAAAVAFLALGSLPQLAFQWRDRSFGRFLPAEIVETLRVTDRESSEGDVVLAGPAISGFVPGWAGATAFWGHWAMTPDLEGRRRTALTLMTPSAEIDRETVRRLLLDHQIRFVLVDAASQSSAAEQARSGLVETGLPVSPFTRPVYRSERTLLLEVLPDLLDSEAGAEELGSPEWVALYRPDRAWGGYNLDLSWRRVPILFDIERPGRPAVAARQEHLRTLDYVD